MRSLLVVGLGFAVSIVPAAVQANERHFVYTYESATLAAGTAELEPWATWRVGREEYYSRFDTRLELELGLTDRLQTAVYLNASARAEDDATNERQTSFAFAGVSSEWKYRLLDAASDAIGMALYFEVTVAPTEVELEQKLIFDRRFGEVLLALNLVAEQEVDMSTPGQTETEHELETDAAIAWYATERLTVGAELRTHTEVAGGEYEHTAFFFGPTVSYAAESYWIAFGAHAQLFAIQGEDHAGDDVRDLHEHEMVNARVLVGLHLD